MEEEEGDDTCGAPVQWIHSAPTMGHHPQCHSKETQSLSNPSNAINQLLNYNEAGTFPVQQALMIKS